ncbi:MAG: glycosyltransferase family 2 protein [Firmicutes bacterium]|nr:glycosyltransferase family 2 protein [Bacillota bacterium]
MNPTITVIVPVYNTEAYLERCVNSILRQKFQDFELILVDDGSREICAELCDALALRDPRIRVFHQKNRGVSSARNLGLSHARGQYIAFADSDDYVLEHWLSAMYDAAVRTGADIVKCGVYYVSEADYAEASDGRICTPVSPLETIRYEAGRMTGFEFLSGLAAYGYSAVWNQLVKAELFSDCRFPDGHLAEDTKVCAELSQRTDAIERIDTVCYCYMQRSGSLLHTASENYVADNIDTWLWIAQLFRDKYHCEERSRFATVYALSSFLAHSCSSLRINQNFETKEFWEKWNKLKGKATFWEVYHYLGLRVSLQYAVLSVSPKLYRFLMNVLKNHGQKTPQ